MFGLRAVFSVLCGASATACLSSEPVGGTPAETTTDSDGDFPTDTEATGDTPHVSILDDCGFALSCESMTLVDQVYPQSALDCTQSLHSAGMPGLVHVAAIPDGGGSDVTGEAAYVFLADRQVIRQLHDRDCGGPGLACDEDDPWFGWEGHELCNDAALVDDEFSFVDCVPVPDYTCEELAELLAEDPPPTIPCEERSIEDCEGFHGAQSLCHQLAVSNYPSDGCEPLSTEMCLPVALGIHDCEENPTCEVPRPMTKSCTASASMEPSTSSRTRVVGARSASSAARGARRAPTTHPAS